MKFASVNYFISKNIPRHGTHMAPDSEKGKSYRNRIQQTRIKNTILQQRNFTGAFRGIRKTREKKKTQTQPEYATTATLALSLRSLNSIVWQFLALEPISCSSISNSIIKLYAQLLIVLQSYGGKSSKLNSFIFRKHNKPLTCRLEDWVIVRRVVHHSQFLSTRELLIWFRIENRRENPKN